MEILVFVAVVAILIVLLMPTFGRAVQSVKETKALVTMHNLLRCANLEMTDNDGKIAYRKKVPVLGRLYWCQYFVMDYCDYDPDGIRSPLDTTWNERLDANVAPAYPLPPTGKYTCFSHAMNLGLTPRQTAPDIEGLASSLHFWSLAALGNPSKTALFFEGMGTQGGVSSGSDLKKFLRFSGPDGQFLNVGYLDGHVGKVSKIDILEPTQSSWTAEERKVFWTSHE